MIRGHLIKQKINVEDYLAIIKNFKEDNIKTTDHTFFRLKEGERKVFKDNIIKEIILADKPLLVGIQNNGNYASFYRYGKDILRLVLDIQITKLKIVTFYIIDEKQVPKI